MGGVGGETKKIRFSKEDLTPEVLEDINRVQDKLPPIQTIFVRKDNSHETTIKGDISASSEGVPATPDLGSPEKQISPSQF